MAVPTIVQTPTTVLVSAAASGSIAFGSNVTAGNSLIAFLAQSLSATRTWTVDDTANGGTDYTAAIRYNPGRAVEIHYFHDTAGGANTVTFTISSGTMNAMIGVSEVSGLANAAPSATGSYSDPAITDNHVSNASALTGTDAYVVTAACLTSAATECSAGSGYAEITGTSNQFCHQHKAVASQNDDGPWTSTGTDRLGVSAMAVFEAPASAGIVGKAWRVGQAVHRSNYY